MESKPGSSGGKILFWVTGLIWTHLFLLQLDRRWLSFLYPDCSLIYRLSLKDGLCFVRVSFIFPPQCEIDNNYIREFQTLSTCGFPQVWPEGILYRLPECDPDTASINQPCYVMLFSNIDQDLSSDQVKLENAKFSWTGRIFNTVRQLDSEDNCLYNILTDWSVYYSPGEETHASK